MSKPKRKNENGQLKKQFKEGQLDGLRLMTTLIYWLLLERHEWKCDDIDQLHKEVMNEFEFITKKYNTWKDIIDTVTEECGITVVYTR